MLRQFLTLPEAEDHRLDGIVVEQRPGQDAIFGRFDFGGQIGDIRVTVAHGNSSKFDLTHLRLQHSLYLTRFPAPTSKPGVKQLVHTQKIAYRFNLSQPGFSRRYPSGALWRELGSRAA